MVARAGGGLEHIRKVFRDLKGNGRSPLIIRVSLPTQSIPRKPTIASSMGKAKSPATPKTLVIPMSLSLDRTWSITVVDAAFCIAAESCEVPLVDIASSVGVDTFDIIDLPFMFTLTAALRLI